MALLPRQGTAFRVPLCLGVLDCFSKGVIVTRSLNSSFFKVCNVVLQSMVELSGILDGHHSRDLRARIVQLVG